MGWPLWWHRRHVTGRADADDLLKHRIVLLDEVVNDESAKLVIAKMLFLQFEDPAAPIHLWVESAGGNILPGLAIMETIKEIRLPVFTRCQRDAHGIAAILVASGRKGHREASKDAHLSIVPLEWPDDGPDEAAKLRLLNELVSAVAERTGQPKEIVRRDFERGRLFDAAGAKDYGLIDAVTA
jgi:ATP-dependent Clp protease protease subunit